MFHRCLFALSIQLSDAENVMKSPLISPSLSIETDQQEGEIKEEALVRFEFKFYFWSK